MRKNSHTSVHARHDKRMGRLRHHPFYNAFWALKPIDWPRAILEDHATTGVRNALKKSANAKRRQRDRMMIGEID